MPKLNQKIGIPFWLVLLAGSSLGLSLVEAMFNPEKFMIGINYIIHDVQWLWSLL